MSPKVQEEQMTPAVTSDDTPGHSRMAGLDMHMSNLGYQVNIIRGVESQEHPY